MSAQEEPDQKLGQAAGEEQKRQGPSSPSQQRPKEDGQREKSIDDDQSAEKAKKAPKVKKKYQYLVNTKTSEANNPANPMNIGDPEVYRQELELMKSTHKVLVGRIDAGVKRKRQPDVRAEDKMYDFINYTTVKEMIEGYLGPLAKQIPAMRKDITQIDKASQAVQGQMKNVNGEVSAFREQMRDFNTLQTEIQRLRANLQYVETYYQETASETKSTFADLRTEIRDFLNITDIQNGQMGQMKDQLENNLKIMEQHHSNLEHIFKCWMNDQGAEMAKVKKFCNEVAAEQKVARGRVTEFNQSIQGQVDRSIQELYAQTKLDEEQMNHFERRIKACEAAKTAFSAVKSNVDWLQRQQTDAACQPKFMAESLPVLLHTSVCEALDRVVGEDYRKNLLEFENDKIKEIHQYVCKSTGPRCVYVMHNRLLSLLKYYKAQDRGVLPFVYGRDLYDNMTYEDYSQVGLQTQQQMQARLAKRLEEEHDYKECYNQAMKSREQQSPVVLEHALKRLSWPQLNLLRDQILLNRVKVKKNFDDIVIEAPRPAVQVVQERAPSEPDPGVKSFSDSKYSSRAGMAESAEAPKEREMPEHFFVFARDGLRPYQRLDKKFQALFDAAYVDFKRFKQNEIRNFSRTTEVCLQLSQDIDVVKSVILNAERTFDEFEGLMTISTAQLQAQADDSTSKGEKHAKSIQRLQTEMSRVADQSEMADSRCDTADRQVHALEERIDQLQQELEEQRKCIEDQTKFVQLELQSQKRALHLQESKMSSHRVNWENTSGDTSPMMDGQKRDQSQSPVDRRKGGDMTLRLEDTEDDAQERDEGSAVQPPSASHTQRQPNAQTRKTAALDFAFQATTPGAPELRGATHRKTPSPEKAEEPARKSPTPPDLALPGPKRSPAQIKPTKTASLKPNKDAKLNKQAKFEERKRQQEQVEKRRKEREGQQERDRQEAERAEQEEQEQREAERARSVQQKQAEAKQKMRKALLNVMQKESKCVALTKSFLVDLGDQNVSAQVQQDKIDVKTKTRTVPGGASAGDKILVQDLQGGQQPKQRPLKGDQPKAPGQKGPQVPAKAAPADDSFASDDSDLEERYKNPFKQIFAGTKAAKDTIDEDKLAAILKPKFEEVYGKIKKSEKSMNEKAKAQEARVEKQLEEQTKTFQDFIAEQEGDQQKIFNQMGELEGQLYAKEQELKDMMADMQKGIDQERMKNVKIRQTMTQDVAAEVGKICGHDLKAKQEFQRVNAYIDASHQLLKTLLEDSMLMQMMQEQDIIDRKQINLVGIKKNQQILGLNQYAMSGNVLSNEKMATIDADGELNGSGKPRFWDLRNKNKGYNKVVKRPDISGSNIRGADVKESGKNKVTLASLHKSLNLNQEFNEIMSEQISSPLMSPKVMTRNIDKTTQAIASPLSDYSKPQTPASPSIRGLTTQAISHNDSTKPFAQRVQAAESEPYNTLFIDRSCASCMSGMGPQILKQVKMACLNYINQPIKYKLPYAGKGASNPLNQVQLSFTDVTLIKEHLLLQCQNQLEVIDNILCQNQCIFGSIAPTANIQQLDHLYKGAKHNTDRAIKTELNVEEFLKREHVSLSEEPPSPTLPSQVSQLKSGRGFEDDSNYLPSNRKPASPTKFGDHSVWNTTERGDESPDIKDNKKEHSGKKPVLQAKGQDSSSKEASNKKTGPCSAQMSNVKLSQYSRINTGLQQPQSPGVLSAQAIKRQTMSPPQLKQSDTQFSFIKHQTKKQKQRKPLDISILQTERIDPSLRPKFKIDILQDMIQAKRDTQKTLTAKRYMENLQLEQLEQQQARNQMSKQLKEKTFQLQLAQTQEKEFKRVTQLVGEASVITQQRQQNDWNMNSRKLHSSLNQTRSGVPKFGRLSNSIQLNMKQLGNIAKDDKQMLITRQLAHMHQSVQKRPESVGDSQDSIGPIANLQIRDRSNEASRQGRNRTVLSINNYQCGTGRTEKKPVKIATGNQLSPDATPTAAENYTDLSITNSVWPRTCKNTRYESIHDNQILAFDALNDGHPALETHAHSLQVSPENLQHVIVTTVSQENPSARLPAPTGPPATGRANLNLGRQSALDKQKGAKARK